MVSETKVTTSYCNGTIISMEAVPTMCFLENIAITTIVQCREMISKEKLGVLERTTGLPYYDDLVTEYCPGLHGVVLANMLAQNVYILYNFVRDCVLNETVSGLHLFRNKSKNKKPVWKLITLAIDEYVKFIEREYKIRGEETPIPAYDEYNKEFEKLMSGK